MTFEFNGDWKFDLELEELSKLHSDNWFSSEKQIAHKTKLNNGLVPFQIIDTRNYEPDPTYGQIQTIDFIINNQHQILESLYQEIKNQINPWYAEACGEYDWIPKLESKLDLGLHLGIHNIQVLPDEKEHLCYYRIDAEYIGDQEHGLALVLHENEVIGHSGLGSMGYECISEDLNLDKEAVFKKHLALQDFGRNMVHQPISKYGKLKPWQEEATEDYLRQLLYQKRNDEFIKVVEESKWDINHRFQSLGNNCVDLAAYGNNAEMIEYLIKRDADISKSILQCTNHKINKEAIRCLVKHGANIDQMGYWEVTALKNQIFNYVNQLSTVDRYKRDKHERLEDAINQLEEYKDKLLFYIEMGANPNSLDKYGNDFKTLLRKRWNEDYLVRHRIFEKIENLISGKPIKNSKWKFWKRKN